MGLFDSLFGFLGASSGGDEINSGINKGIAAQTDYYNKALDFSKEQYAQSREDFAPFLKGGTSALDRILSTYGLNGGAPDMSGFFKSPDYNFRLQEGQNAIDASAAARGSLDSGATRKAQIEYAGNLASSEFDGYIGKLMQLAGFGPSAASGLGTLGANNANNVTGLMTNQGNNLASSYLARGMNNATTIGTMYGYGSQAAGSLFGSGNPSSLLSMFGGGFG
jgi:hypothetical protein